MSRQLTAEEAAAFRARLQHWQSPDDFKLALDEVMAIVGGDYLLLNRAQFFRRQVRVGIRDLAQMSLVPGRA